MEHTEIVRDCLLPTDEQASKTIEPRVRPLHDPTSCLETGIPLFRLNLFSASSNVCGVAVLADEVFHFGIVVAFVQAEVLFVAACWLRRFDHALVERWLDEFHVVPVRSGNDDGDGNAFGLGQETAFGAAFPAIRGVWSRFSPPNGAFVMAPSMDCHFQFKPTRSS